MKLEYNTIFKVSNLLSLGRVFLSIPVFFLLAEINNDEYTRWIIFGILLLAAVTDYLDGFYARKLDQITELGKMLDPLADKLMMGIIVFRLYQLDMMPDFLFWIIIGRDILIFLGGIIVSKKLNKIIPSNMLGKITVFVLGLMTLVIISGIHPESIVYQFFLYASVALCFMSFFVYIYRAIEMIKWEKNGNI